MSTPRCVEKAILYQILESNDHHHILTGAFKKHINKDFISPENILMIVAKDGQQIECDRFLISMWSPFVSSLLASNPSCTFPTLILSDFKANIINKFIGMLKYGKIAFNGISDIHLLIEIANTVKVKLNHNDLLLENIKTGDKPCNQIDEVDSEMKNWECGIEEIISIGVSESINKNIHRRANISEENNASDFVDKIIEKRENVLKVNNSKIVKNEKFSSSIKSNKDNDNTDKNRKTIITEEKSNKIVEMETNETDIEEEILSDSPSIDGISLSTNLLRELLQSEDEESTQNTILNSNKLLQEILDSKSAKIHDDENATKLKEPNNVEENYVDGCIEEIIEKDKNEFAGSTDVDDDSDEFYPIPYNSNIVNNTDCDSEVEIVSDFSKSNSGLIDGFSVDTNLLKKLLQSENKEDSITTKTVKSDKPLKENLNDVNLNNSMVNNAEFVSKLKLAKSENNDNSNIKHPVCQINHCSENLAHWSINKVAEHYCIEHYKKELESSIEEDQIKLNVCKNCGINNFQSRNDLLIHFGVIHCYIDYILANDNLLPIYPITIQKSQQESGTNFPMPKQENPPKSGKILPIQKVYKQVNHSKRTRDSKDLDNKAKKRKLIKTKNTEESIMHDQVNISVTQKTEGKYITNNDTITNHNLGNKTKIIKPTITNLCEVKTKRTDEIQTVLHDKAISATHKTENKYITNNDTNDDPIIKDTHTFQNICQICKKQEKSLSKLWEHCAAHFTDELNSKFENDIKKNTCLLCNKRFGAKTNVVRHIATTHTKLNELLEAKKYRPLPLGSKRVEITNSKKVSHKFPYINQNKIDENVIDKRNKQADQDETIFNKTRTLVLETLLSENSDYEESQNEPFSWDDI